MKLTKTQLRQIIREELLNEESIDQEYADRLIGAGLNKKETMSLAQFYLDTPEEVPKPMKYTLFKRYYKKIIINLKNTPNQEYG